MFILFRSVQRSHPMRSQKEVITYGDDFHHPLPRHRADWDGPSRFIVDYTLPGRRARRVDSRYYFNEVSQFLWTEIKEGVNYWRLDARVGLSRPEYSPLGDSFEG